MAPLVISLVLTGIRFSWSRYRLPALTDLMEMSLPPSPEGFHLDPLVYLLSGLLALTVMILFYRVDSPFQKAGLLALISLPSLSAVFYWWSSTALGNLMVIRAGGMGGIYGYGCILAPLLSLATEMGVVFLFLFVFPARKRGGVPADPPPSKAQPLTIRPLGISTPLRESSGGSLSLRSVRDETSRRELIPAGGVPPRNPDGPESPPKDQP